ncbi:hypothetical protein BASA81_003174 [Batrachochytrium salamandrivorans]|nr:hypothetical protein BASA81_003174 [Batrachochytrium salamandrivorans]
MRLQLVLLLLLGLLGLCSTVFAVDSQPVPPSLFTRLTRQLEEFKDSFMVVDSGNGTTTTVDGWTMIQTTLSHATSSSSSACVPHNFSAGANKVTMWGWQGWYVLACLFVLFAALFFEYVPIEFAMVGCVLMICAAQIITVPDMTAGFANAGILAVVCLFIIAEALTATGAIDYFLGKLLGEPSTLGQALVRMMIPCAFVAAWISSTAVVALMIPVVQRWGKKINQPPSLLMMPMCYAVHLGGTVTLVGTTTNLVISGLYNSYYCRTMGIFELSPVGLPVAIAGLGALLLLTPKVLPNAAEYERRTSHSGHVEKRVGCCTKMRQRLCCCFRGKQEPEEPELPNYTSDFTFDALVPDALNGQSIADAGLRDLKGLFLTTVVRTGVEEKTFHAVGPEFMLATGDRVSFAGQADNFLAFCKDRGLVYVTEGYVDEEFGAVGGTDPASDPLAHCTIEVVVSRNSDLVSKTMKEVNFRSKYHAAALAVHRAGEKVNTPGSKLGQITLKVGDVLLLVVGDDFSWEDPETNRDLKPRKRQLAVGDKVPNSSSLGVESQTLVMDGDTGSGSSDAEEEVKGKSTMTATTTSVSEYIFSMRISPNRRLVGVPVLGGMNLEDAGLRNIPGLTVVAVTRGENTEKAIGADYVLQAEDIIWFSGGKEGLSSLRRVPGLEDLDSLQVKQLGLPIQSRRLVEVVVSLNSDLLYKTVKESRFRTRFQAAIVAIQRRDQRVLARIGDIELEPGDVLILDAGPDFAKRFENDDNFLVISEVEQSTPPRMDRFYIAAFAAISMIVCTAATGMDLLLFALFAAGIVLGTKVLTRERAHKAIDWKIIITVAAAFGLSTAMTNTKVATVIGNAITDLAISTNTGEIGVLAVVMIFTEILCAFITAKAGALLMFPIAADAAWRLNIEPVTMTIALMLGSSDYTTPQGHQTNLMVLSPGAYKFVDYQKMGLPLELYLNIVQLLCLSFIDLWYICLVVAILILFLMVVIDHTVVSGLPLRAFFHSYGSCCCCCCSSRNARKKKEEVAEEDSST